MIEVLLHAFFSGVIAFGTALGASATDDVVTKGEWIVSIAGFLVAFGKGYSDRQAVPPAIKKAAAKAKKIITPVVLLVAACYVTPTWALNCTFTWEAPTKNADGSSLDDLAGYRLYSSTVSGQYGLQAGEDVPASTSTATRPCSLGQFWVVRAFDTAGNVSANSNEVQVRDTMTPGAPGTMIIILTP